MLLTLIAARLPGRRAVAPAGRRHRLTASSRPPALLRELVEETGQRGRVTDLLAVSHLHNPAALGPEGCPLDWHVRPGRSTGCVVDVPTEPRGHRGSRRFDRRGAAWFTPAQLSGLPLTDVAGPRQPDAVDDARS